MGHKKEALGAQFGKAMRVSGKLFGVGVECQVESLPTSKYKQKISLELQSELNISVSINNNLRYLLEMLAQDLTFYFGGSVNSQL